MLYVHIYGGLISDLRSIAWLVIWWEASWLVLQVLKKSQYFLWSHLNMLLRLLKLLFSSFQGDLSSSLSKQNWKVVWTSKTHAMRESFFMKLKEETSVILNFYSNFQESMLLQMLILKSFNASLSNRIWLSWVLQSIITKSYINSKRWFYQFVMWSLK